MSLLFFVIGLGLIFLEGFLCVSSILRTHRPTALSVTLAFPAGVVVNALLYATLALLHFAIRPVSLLTTHGVILIFLIYVYAFHIKKNSQYDQIKYSGNSFRVPAVVLGICLGIIALNLDYGASHSMLLPTFHYDSAAVWNLRSKVALEEGTLSFSDYEGLIRKSNYPVLHTALSLQAHLGAPPWNEHSANGSHYLLTLSALLSLFLLIRKTGGIHASVVSLALITGIPLFSVQLGMQYADIPFTLFALLSLASLLHFLRAKDTRWILLSALFVSGCVWTKSDGLFLCLIPWMATVLTLALKSPQRRRSVTRAVIFALVLSFPWPLVAFLSDVALTPHGGADFALVFHLDAVTSMASAMFVSGSFGIHWYMIFGSLLLFYHLIKSERVSIDSDLLPCLLWGLLSLLGYMAIYLFTSNSAYLLSGQSFDRQLLLPASLLTLAIISVLLVPKRAS